MRFVNVGVALLPKRTNRSRMGAAIVADPAAAHPRVF
jgi:hypothetical protein